jgi:TonB family protein
MREAVALAAAFLFLPALAAFPESPKDEGWGDRLYGIEEKAVPTLRSEAIEGFDSAGGWIARSDSSDVLLTLKPFELTGSEEARSRYALGVKAEFLSRGSSSAYILAARPLSIGTRCVMISVRALGRNFPHELYVVVNDYYGRPYELSLGSLDFTGWKKLSAYVPLPDPGTREGIVQDDRHYDREAGLRIAGFKLAFDPEESYGSYYLYLEGLEATIEGSADESEISPEAELPPAPKEAAAGAKAEPQASAQERSEARVLSLISRRISEGLVYPDAARRRGIEGSLVASFVVNEDGSLASSRVARSSGSDILDRAGLELLRSAFPVENDSGQKLDLRISIGYELSP